MDLKNLKRIIRLLEQSNIDEIEVEEEGIKIRVSRNMHNSLAPQTGQSVLPAAGIPQQQAVVASGSAEPTQAPTKKEPAYHEVKSPIVGTFYRAPAPDADSYVEVGQVIQKGAVLCIIEAMKLMNEIESDISGRIVKICVDNSQPVEYNQVLFLVEPV